MLVIYNGNQINIEEGTTLRTLVSDTGDIGKSFLINGATCSPDIVLSDYNVIEITEEGTSITNATASTPVASGNVSVDLTDFTGRTGLQTVSTDANELRSNYENEVAISIIRDNQPIDTEELHTGDRVTIMPSGGVRGA